MEPALGTPPVAAVWLLLPAVPIGLYSAFTDLREMRIPNHAVAALVIGFAVFGLVGLPFADWAWRWLNLAVVLALGVAFYAAGALGAGDAKFAAAAAPYVAAADWPLVTILLAGISLAAWAAHRVARASPLRSLAPHWKSWTSGKRFPLGLALGPTLIAYLVIAALSAG
jgi:prepilin peptidase CpaA